MSSVLRAIALVWGLTLVACGSGSSTTVRVAVNNSPDSEDPNLVVNIEVRDEDADPDGGDGTAVVVVSQPATAAPPLPELAFVVDAQRVEVVDGNGDLVWQVESTAIDAGTELAWLDDERLLLSGADGVYAARRGDEPRRIATLPGASAIETSPALTSDVRVLLVVAPAAPDAPEDVFAVFFDPDTGGVRGVQNLTRTPNKRELDATWLGDGSRIAILERTVVDVVVVRAFELRSGEGVEAELGPERQVVWLAAPGDVGDVSGAHTLELLAISTWAGGDWDVLWVDLAGNARSLGRPARDEFAPSWSRDDARLAVAQGDSRPILIWELGEDLEVVREYELHGAGGAPAFY